MNRLEMLEKAYRADNTRLERFRTELPADEKQWDEFFTTHFHPAGAGYSAISEDLGDLSRSSGLQSDTITFHQHDPDARGLMEIGNFHGRRGRLRQPGSIPEQARAFGQFLRSGQPRAGFQHRREASPEFAVEDLFPDHLT